MKLNVLLGKRQHSMAIFREQIKDTIAAWNKPNLFRAIRKSYIPRGDNPPEPAYSGHERMVTTVERRFKYLEETCAAYIDQFLSVEATNATSAKADLVVDGKTWGQPSTMELLALKSCLVNGDLLKLYEEIPVRDETKKWDQSKDEEYKRPGMYTHDPTKGVNKVGELETYILEDPNVSQLKDTSKYVPVQAVKKTETIKGDYTVEFFSSEYSHEERAEILDRRSKLLGAVLEALEKCNDVEVAKSQLTAAKIFDYIHRGKNG